MWIFARIYSLVLIGNLAEVCRDYFKSNRKDMHKTLVKSSMPDTDIAFSLK